MAAAVTRASKALVVIPARIGSTRLPGKALADIHGQPMIARVVHAALAADVGAVVVATDDARIAAAASAAGAAAVMTEPDLPSGTDRVAAAVRLLADDSPLIINVQGDEPLLPPAAIRAVAERLRCRAGVDISTLSSPMGADELADPSRVKVVVDGQQRALYFSRAPIGVSREHLGGLLARQHARVEGGERHLCRLHLGIYGFKRAALMRMVSLPQSPLEVVESLEQLRALDAGMHISVGEIDRVPHGVDTADDLHAVRRIINGQRQPGTIRTSPAA